MPGAPRLTVPVSFRRLAGSATTPCARQPIGGVGQPLSPRTMATELSAVQTLFLDNHEWG